MRSGTPAKPMRVLTAADKTKKGWTSNHSLTQDRGLKAIITTPSEFTDGCVHFAKRYRALYSPKY